jgi:hypothetical protein
VQKGDKKPEVSPPQTGTFALIDYLWATFCDRRLFYFVVDVVLQRDYAAHIARQALDGLDEYKQQSPADLAESNPGIATKALRQSRQELLEMFLSRAVDNFDVYLVDIIRLALNKEPRILSDRKQEFTLGHILKFDSIEALSRNIIEGKLNSLSYEGFAELEAWCNQRSIPLVVPEGERDRIVELIALRNIIVHSRGRVDERYLAAVPGSTYKLGEKRELDTDDLIDAMSLLDSVVGITDVAVAGKFRLETSTVQNELNTRSDERWRKSVKNEGSGDNLPSDSKSETVEEE